MSHKQAHHIVYDPEWVVRLTGWQHKVVTHMQGAKTGWQQYWAMLQFQHAITHEVNNMAFKLMKYEDRNLNPGLDPVKSLLKAVIKDLEAYHGGKRTGNKKR